MSGLKCGHVFVSDFTVSLVLRLGRASMLEGIQECHINSIRQKHSQIHLVTCSLVHAKQASETLQGRCYHTATANIRSSKFVEVVLFGGTSKSSESSEDLGKTAVLRFGESNTLQSPSYRCSKQINHLMQ